MHNHFIKLNQYTFDAILFIASTLYSININIITDVLNLPAFRVRIGDTIEQNKKTDDRDNLFI